MRSLFACLLLLVGAVPLRSAEAEFLRVWPGWRDAESFERISEYFGGGENAGRQVVLRTQAAAREGFYFLVRVRAAAALANARYELSVIRPDAPDTRVYKFPASIPAKETVFQLGITGADWPEGKDAHPVAWKLVLLSADGHPLAEQKSYLWEKPAK
ncbi:MAG TPA: hypothetical protein VM029_00990 [Opitutaceae bacterium]|nr:hypothetical protein [Opitutaceae bacterium]